MCAPIVPLGKQDCVSDVKANGDAKPTGGGDETSGTVVSSLQMSGMEATQGFRTIGCPCVCAAVRAGENATVGLGSVFMGLFAMTAECANHFCWLGLFDALRSAMANIYGNIKPFDFAPVLNEPGHYHCGS